jgi:hypothetical protein
VVHKTGDVVMPSGLRIDLNDGTVMEITAGMRCPSFCQQVSAAWDVNQYDSELCRRQSDWCCPGIPFFNVPGYKPDPHYRDVFGYSVSGNVITLNTWWSDNWGAPGHLIQRSGKSCLPPPGRGC